MALDDTAAERAAQVRDLEKELVATRKLRVAMQREAAEGPGLALTRERVDRDRSAISSPQVEELRMLTQQRFDDLCEVWAGVDRTRHLVGLLRKAHHADYSAITDAFAAELRTRQEAANSAAAAHVELSVPGISSLAPE